MIRRLRAVPPRAALVLALGLAGCGASVVPQLHSDASRLPVARQMLAKGEIAIAVDLLSNYVLTGTGSADIDQAVFTLGVAYTRQREWASAQTQFERVLRDYPESDSSGAASYLLGLALDRQARAADFDQDFTHRAISQWKSFLADHPDDAYAPLANQGIAACRVRLARKLWRVGDVYVKLKLYDPAISYFRQVLTDYADTPVVGDALLGLAVADARIGRKDTALVVLRGLARDFQGRPLGLQAARLGAKVEKWPAAGDRSRRAHRSVEPETVPAPTPSIPTPGMSERP